MTTKSLADRINARRKEIILGPPPTQKEEQKTVVAEDKSKLKQMLAELRGEDSTKPAQKQEQEKTKKDGNKKPDDIKQQQVEDAGVRQQAVDNDGDSGEKESTGQEGQQYSPTKEDFDIMREYLKAINKGIPGAEQQQDAGKQATPHQVQEQRQAGASDMSVLENALKAGRANLDAKVEKKSIEAGQDTIIAACSRHNIPQKNMELAIGAAQRRNWSVAAADIEKTIENVAREFPVLTRSDTISSVVAGNAQNPPERDYRNMSAEERGQALRDGLSQI